MVIPDIQEAVSLIESGQHAEAIPLLEKLTQRMPMYVTVDVLLARAYEAAEQWGDALTAWQRARFLMPNSFTVREGLQRVQGLLAVAEQAAEQEQEATSLGLDLFWDEAREAFISPEEDRLGEDGFVFNLSGSLEEDREAASAAQATLAIEAHTLVQEDADDEREATPGTMAAAQAALAVEEAAPFDLDDASYDPTADVTLATSALAAAEEDEELVVEGWEELEELFEVPAPSPTPVPPGDMEDLDRLIGELESARIVPRPDLDDIPPPDLEDEIGDMVSETLARIFASQKQYEEAARIFEQLARQQPDKAKVFLEQASEIRALASGNKSADQPSEES